nr:VWA domain-containing protein [Amylibacter sp.]
MNELEKLQSLLRDTPAPNADAKAAALRAATENFARFQEQGAQARPIPEAPAKGSLWKGLADMFNRSTLRPALYASTCLVIAGVAYTSYQPWSETLPELQDAGRATQLAAAPEESLQKPPQAPPTLAPKPAPQKQAAAQSAAAPLAHSQESDSIAPHQKQKTYSALGAMAGLDAPSGDTITHPLQGNADQFTGASENPLKITAQDPVSTFSIDVDTASYAYVRASLLNGGPLNPDAIRIEEMINYFTYDYPAPSDPDQPFSTQISVTKTPWNPETQLVQIGIQGMKPAIENRPPLNLVFLIDTSGSMQSANKLPLLTQSFALMLGELRPTDQVAIVTYAGSAGTALPPTNASETATILGALDRLNASGSTAGQAGLRQAYALADQMTQDGDISRVLLATDGDFNVGINNPDQMKSFIESQRDSGTYLSVLGFGRGNYRDDIMQSLAQNGNGTAAYIDTLAEAQKVLVDQLSGALFPIANDVKIQVEFNPAEVAEYRLIGYETRTLNREDFNNDTVDAGEIGAGHQVTALYEITPVGSPAILNDPLRYTEQAASNSNDELGYFKLRYKKPGAAASQLVTTPIRTNGDLPDAGFAAAIAGFGQVLKHAAYIKNWSYDDAITLATANKGPDPFGYRAEAIRLMKLAKIRD